MAKTLKEISTAYCAKQPHQIDYVLESAPFLARVPFQATSKGLMHFFEKVKSVDAAGFVGIDEALPVADVDTEVESRTLGIMGFKIHGGVDTVKLVTKGGTFAEYLAAKSPKVMTASGMALERKISRLAKVYAARNGRLIDAGGTGDSTYTIMAFRLLEGELCGLYDPNGFGQGAFFTTQLLNGGQLYEDPATGKDLYGASFRSYVDFMMENPAVLAPIQTSLSDGEALGAILPPAFTRPVKLNLGPVKCSSLLSAAPVSLCFHRRGRPSGVAFPEITAAVQAADLYAGNKKRTPQARILLKNLRKLDYLAMTSLIPFQPFAGCLLIFELNNDSVWTRGQKPLYICGRSSY